MITENNKGTTHHEVIGLEHRRQSGSYAFPVSHLTNLRFMERIPPELLLCIMRNAIGYVSERAVPLMYVSKSWRVGNV
jgi:hypothetical protein